MIIFRVILFLFLPFLSFSQGEIDESSLNTGRNEHTFTIVFNSNGWGIGYRHGKRIDAFSKRLLEIDYIGIKHPKEVKSYNDINTSQKKFVYGKVNQFTALRIGIGKQKELFSKADKGGIAIRYYYSFGLSLGFLKPVYYEVAYPYPDNFRLYYLVVEQYNFYQQHSEGFVYGKASYFEGIGETKIKPGAYFKIGAGFDFSPVSEKIRTIEAGFSIDVFTDVIRIMATQENSQIFPAFFINYRFGKTYSRRLKNIE